MKLTDEKIVAALLTTATIADAAKTLHVGERYIYKRLQAQRIQTLLRDAQTEMLGSAVSEMRKNLTKSAEVITSIMLDSNTAPQTRLNAAATLQNSYLRLSERQDVTERLDRLERLYGV